MWIKHAVAFFLILLPGRTLKEGGRCDKVDDYISTHQKSVFPIWLYSQPKSEIGSLIGDSPRDKNSAENDNRNKD